RRHRYGHARSPDCGGRWSPSTTCAAGRPANQRCTSRWPKSSWGLRQEASAVHIGLAPSRDTDLGEQVTLMKGIRFDECPGVVVVVGRDDVHTAPEILPVFRQLRAACQQAMRVFL